ncbi:hypothetical protein [Microbacterium sp. No. 7]|uniref:hypothetical protein n=1 Tax=Microbacterium sp. No. 7 TaxID=1714373 RepID=UPI0006D1693E|nr:hypothetical protein [Microbacterium sp. No. 7]ALJ21739.1 hypothetical protein AOA12_18310 [Microbacterium sp. No. 7]
MIALALTSALVLLAALAALQVLVALGLPLGRFVWGGRHRVLPTGLRIGSAVSVVLYAAMAALLLSRAGVIPGGDSPFVRVATWVLFGYFALGILMNAISRSRPERLTMTPVTIVLAAATLVVALTGSR